MTNHRYLTLIIGDPVDHSLSPLIHNAGYASLSLPYTMQRAKVSLDQLRNFFAGARAFQVAGMAITMPLKVDALSLVDEVDDCGTQIGAINTVYRSGNGTLVGTNTDWIGIAAPLAARGDLSGQNVAIIGAGGAALAALFACNRAGAAVTIFNRSEERAREICARWGATYAGLYEIRQLSRYDVVINATPLGMTHLESSPSPALFSDVEFSRSQILFETIYSPRDTPLVVRGEACGSTVITGDEMFAEQAIAQFTLHTGHPAPREIMVATLRKQLGLST
jgi:shikimate dehydrogenase